MGDVLSLSVDGDFASFANELRDVDDARMPTPFSEIFIDPFVVGGLLGMKLEEVMVSEFAFAKKLKGEGLAVADGVVLKPENELNALLAEP